MANKFSKGGSNVDSGSGSKSGKKDKGSVSDLNQSNSVTRNEQTHDVQFAKGGAGHMFNEQAAGPQKSGGTAHDVSGGVPGDQYACGGKTKMFGFAAAQPATAGITGAR